MQINLIGPRFYVFIML